MFRLSNLFQVKADARPQAQRTSELGAQRIDTTLCGIKYELAALRFEVATIRHAYVCRKAGFNPDQPRWPKGSGEESGRWSGGAGTGSTGAPGATHTIDLSAMRRKPNVPGLTVPHSTPPSSSPAYTPGQVTIVNNAQTGMSVVDDNTEKLRAVLEKVVNSRGEGYGSQYGTAIHTDFANAVKAENLPGIGERGVEQSFDPRGGVTEYGSKESVRTDIVLRSDGGDVIAVYDVKTGGARLDARRVQELRSKTGAGARVPVIEMHIQRGLSLKARIGRGVWIITLRLWNPWIRGSADR